MGNKIPAIRGFVVGLMEYRKGVKEDALKLLGKLDLATLSDPEELKAFLEEMVYALSKKHLVNNNGRIQPTCATLVKSYVKGMLKR